MPRKLTGFFGSVIKYLKSCVKFTPLFFRRFDLVHLHFFYPLIWPVLLYKFLHPRTPIIVSFHGSDLHLRFNARLFNLLHNYALKKVDLIHCVGQDLADELFDTFEKNASLIMPMGVDKNVFKREKRTIESKKYDFIFVGSFLKGKGIDLILNSLSMITDRKVKYCFVGSGPEEYLIKQKAKFYQIDIYNNLPQNKIAKILQQSKFLLLPSRYETFGLVVTEALYCGVPCIVSKRGGLQEQIIDSINGFFIKELASDSLATLMNRALSMTDIEYLTMSKNAERSNEAYSLENVIDKIESVYHKLIMEAEIQ